ncbi:unnamed protein product [Parajaminaea phylloscopi]
MFSTMKPLALCLATLALLAPAARAEEQQLNQRATGVKTVTKVVTVARTTVTRDNPSTVTSTLTQAGACSVGSGSNSNVNNVRSSSTQRAVTSSATSRSSSAASSTGTGSGTTAGNLLLAAHNAKRAIHSAPNLTWNQDLADYAQAYGSKCVFKHSGGPYGENLAAGAPYNYYSPEDLFQGWYDEGKNYDYSTTSFSSAAGHFTQVVWKSSTQVGCAAISCDSSSLGLGNNGKGIYIVCEYSPPGNVQGRFTQNVLPPKSS